MKKIIGTITGLIILFVLLTFMIAYIILNNGSFLTKFEFTNVTNAGLNYYVYFEKVKAAENYDVIVYDNLDNTLKSVSRIAEGNGCRRECGTRDKQGCQPSADHRQQILEDRFKTRMHSRLP